MFLSRTRANAIALTPPEDLGGDSDLFGGGVRNPEAQRRIQAAMSRGFQNRDAEMNLTQLLSDLNDD